MDEVISQAPGRTPGVILFVAILNFLSAAIGFIVALCSVLALALGASAGLYEQITHQLSQAQPPVNLSFGVTFFFMMILALGLAFGAFFLTIGLGLLKRKRYAWYLQVAMSVVGLLGFPFGTIVNGLILAFFFQSNVRNFFNI